MDQAAAIDAPFRHSGLKVLPEWIDYNGHMNVAYYIVLADRVTDAAFESLGMGETYVGARNASFFTVEMHVCYLRELPVDAPVAGTFRLVAHDAKRIRALIELMHATDGFVAATAEMLFVHVDMGARRAAPFPPDIVANIAAMQANHDRLPRPERAGRAITLGD